MEISREKAGRQESARNCHDALGEFSLAQDKSISPALSSRGNPAERSCALMGKGQSADLKDAHISLFLTSHR